LPLTLTQARQESPARSFHGGIASGTDYKAPVTGIERGLAAVWEEVLGRTGIGLEDNFFRPGRPQPQGHRLVSHIYKHFHVKLPLEEVFALPLLGQQAACLPVSPDTNSFVLMRRPRAGELPLVFGPRSGCGCQPVGPGKYRYTCRHFRLEGPLEVAALEAAFRALWSRHESLRTVFRQDEQG
jgi:hypothetical protein